MTPGSAGEAVRDLQRRLGAAGVALTRAEPGVYCAVTEAAVRSFQVGRGLHADGICGPQTWGALVEAGYGLGDRVLYLRAPMLRGDDVGELQRRLGQLGFDAGRIDGIYGPLTADALAEFQRNVGLGADGICGFDTVRALHRLGSRADGAPAVAAIREHERLLAAPRTLDGHRIVIGQTGGLAALSRASSRAVRRAGASVITVDDPDGSHHASAANQFAATLYVGFAPGRDCPTVAYYAVPGFESGGGRHLALRLATALGPALDGQVTAHGMRIPVLRETKMPAVLCELSPMATLVARAHELGGLVADTVSEWVAAPQALRSAVPTADEHST